ncbi:MAG: AI-2E family transporter [Candidatus Latescibacterota bacterium]
MKDDQRERYDILLLISAAVLLVSLLFAFREVLSPPIAAAILILFVLPLSSHPIKRSLIILTVFLFVVWFAVNTAAILMPFIISLALAYLFDPVVDRMEKIRLPRTVSVLIIVLFVLGLLTLGSIFLIPQIIRELRELIDQSIVYSNKLADWAQEDGLAFLERFGADNEKLKDIAANELPARLQQVLSTFFKGALNVTSAVSAAFGQLLNLVLVPFLFFYLLKDIDRLKEWARRLFVYHEGWLSETNFAKVDEVLSGYIRGQLIVCFVVGVVTSVALSVLGIRYALILGIVAGVLNLVPYIGLAITLVLGLLVGVFIPSPFITCIKIVVVIEAVQIIEGAVLSPRIVGERVGLHPALVMLAILIFSHFWGLAGLMIAVPLAAIIKIFASAGFSRYLAGQIPAIPETAGDLADDDPDA